VSADLDGMAPYLMSKDVSPNLCGVMLEELKFGCNRSAEMVLRQERLRSTFLREKPVNDSKDKRAESKPSGNIPS
jgi:hypothetical protein